MNNSEKIIKHLERNQTTVNELTEYLGISRQATHKILRKLLENGQITKSGKPPKVFYSISQKAEFTADGIAIDEAAKKIIDRNFLYITPLGAMMSGWEGFAYWCQERGLDTVKMAQTYISKLKYYEKYRKNGLIDGMYKMKSTFRDVALDRVFYLDFYSLEIFGKTKLGQLLLFAKQSQDRQMINEIADMVKPAILKLIKDYKIDGVGFIPPTVKRELQLMKQLEKHLSLDMRRLSITKVKTPIIVPQKTLNKIEDRVANARETIVVEDSGVYENVLLIDDAVGSGATLNETAKKIRQKGLVKGKIIGLAITGSFKGFEIISEI